RHFRNAGNAGGAVGDLAPVDQHQADDLADGQRHDGEGVAPEAQHREAEADAPEGRQRAGGRQQDPEGPAELGAEQRVAIGADGVEGDVAEVEQAGQSDDDVQAPGQHHVDQDLDAEIVDPFQRALEADQKHDDNRVEDQRADGDLGPVPDEGGFLRMRHDRRLRLLELARLEIGVQPDDHQEAPGHHQRDHDGEQAPARHEDQFVADVLVGLDA